MPTASEGGGMFNPRDTVGAIVTVAGYNYPNACELEFSGAVAPAVEDGNAELPNIHIRWSIVAVLNIPAR
jgi:hypothetical protein